MSNSRLKKRFIAGANCPHCGELDKIAWYCDTLQPDDDYIACVRCDYTVSQQDILNLAKATTSAPQTITPANSTKEQAIVWHAKT